MMMMTLLILESVMNAVEDKPTNSIRNNNNSMHHSHHGLLDNRTVRDSREQD
jgi:hypothetical protein